MTSNFERTTQSLEWLRVGDLTVNWPEAQRALSEQAAKRIADAFDPDVFGTLTVSPIGGGKYHVNDGWTRASAARLLFGEKERVPCVVIPADDSRRAAEIFRTINGGRTKPSAMEIFRVSVTSGSPPEVAVNKIATELGLRIDLRNTNGSIAAVGAVLSIYRQYGANGLRLTLSTIRGTWGTEPASFDAQLIRGMAAFLASHSHEIDHPKLIKKLAKRFTPGRLLGSAKATREAFGGSLAKAVGALIAEAYSAGLHAGTRLGTNRAARVAEPAPPPPPTSAPVARKIVRRSASNGRGTHREQRVG